MDSKKVKIEYGDATILTSSSEIYVEEFLRENPDYATILTSSSEIISKNQP